MATVMAMGQATIDKRWLCQTAFWCIFWVSSVFGFIADDVFPALRDYRTLVMLTIDAAMIALACFTVRHRIHLLIIAAFVLFSWIVTCVLCHESPMLWGNGLRDFIGLFLAYPVLLYLMDDETSRERFLSSFDRQGLYFLLLQAFCITVQFFMYGAGDLVGGSFGHYYTGQVSIVIYLMSFFLIRRRIDPAHFFTSLRQNKIYLLLLLPTFLNETKVSFVMLALYLLLLIPADRQMVKRFAIILPIGGLLLWLGLSAYSMTTAMNKSGNSFKSVEDVMEYFVAEELEHIEGDARWNIENNRGVADVPRFSKLMYLAILNAQEPGHMVIGFGIGHFKGGTQLAASQFSRTYDWLLMGSIPYLFHIYIQLGIIGVVLLQLYWLWLAFYRPSWGHKRDLNLQLLLLAVVLLLYLYNDIFRNLIFCLFFFLLYAASWRSADPNDEQALTTP